MMNGFIVYAAYETDESGSFIHLYGRLENGEPFLSITKYRPYFYIKEADLKKAEKDSGFEAEKCGFADFDRNPVARIYAKSPKDVPDIRRSMEKLGIRCYEADILFVNRFLIDNDIRGCVKIKGKARKEGVLNVYENAELYPAEYEVALKTVSVDIETNRNAKQIYCTSLYSADYQNVLIVSGKKVQGAESFATEKEMLEAFRDRINELDPDILTGWNVIDFDFAVIAARFKHYKIPFTIGRRDAECRVRVIDSFMRDSSCNIPGRVVLDGLQLLRSSFVKLDDYKLDSVATTILGEGKAIDKEKNKGELIDLWYKENPSMLAKYNLKDSELVYRILEKKNIIQLTIQRSKLTGLQLDKVKQSILALDSMYLRESRKRKLAAGSVLHSEKEEQIKGAYVMEPKSGLYSYVIVLDYMSLYPNIIRTFNIDPITFNKGDDIIAPNNAHFSADDAILPKIIEMLTKGRAEFKKKKDAVGSYAIKIHMNSIYGALGNPVCRFFNMDIANAITAFAREIIQKTIDLISKRGYNVIYSDTDSVFVAVDAKTNEDAAKTGKNIQKIVNDYYNEYILSEFKQKSFLYLEHDKTFKRFILPKQRHSELGAKKRYAGLLLKDGKEEISFTGIELMRRDWTDLAKKFQLEMLQRVFHDSEIDLFIADFVKNLKSGRFDSLLVYKKSLRKPVVEYTKSTPPHVKAAMKMTDNTSRLIYYIQTVNGPEPVSGLKSKIDYNHYIEKQIKPVADSILNLMNKSFDDIIEGRQKNLSEY